MARKMVRKQREATRALSSRRLMLAGCASIVVMACLLVAWAQFTQISGFLTVEATVLSDSNSRRVQHTQGGFIAKVLIKEGDRVRGGQDLVILDAEEAQTDLAELDKELSELAIIRARLEAQRDGMWKFVLPKKDKTRVSDSRLRGLVLDQQRILAGAESRARDKTAVLNQLNVRLQEMVTAQGQKAAALAREAALVDAELKDLLKLQAKGLVAKSRVQAVEREATRLVGVVAGLASEIAASRVELAAAALAIVQESEKMRVNAETELRALESRIGALEDKHRLTAANLKTLIVRAPTTGTVHQLSVHAAGAVIAQGETLMLILPEGGDLMLRAEVATNKIDRLLLGQSAVVRLTNPGSSLKTEVDATLTLVSDIDAQARSNGQPLREIRLAVSAGELAKRGAKRPPPGSRAEAKLETQAQSVLSFLFVPMTGRRASIQGEN